MDRSQLTRAFAATVQASLHGLQALEAVLRREREALAGRDPEQLHRIVADKLASLKALEPSVKARDRLLAAAGLQPGLDGGGQLVMQLGDASLSRDWSALVTQSRCVAELNDCNAQLAAQGQRAARTALGILTGRPHSEDTYAELRRKPAVATRPILGKV